MVEQPRVEARSLTASYNGKPAIRGVSVAFGANRVHALIGPSGCGKSTFLRTINRMHELVPRATVEGTVLVDGQDIYGASINPMQLRRRVGMVFQKPTPFPTMSVADNVAAGLRILPRGGRPIADVVEAALRRAALWEEVKDRLDASALSLSGGQQQRLCIARTLAPDPAVILLDEPTSALDPTATQRIEELLYDLRADYTIVIVTHNLQQAARVSDTTSFFYLGDLIEHGETKALFTSPQKERTEAYVTGRFG
ncbi:MAG: phosphate ABC transporter ATP-binding protein [Gemmatimonadales bacterium]|nr:MAG: phosphate ABC transporter ATP-binding protein [Gemmatimonadales bacterium]